MAKKPSPRRRHSKVARSITDHKRAKAALKEAEERYRNILESITDAFFVVDHQWRFTYLNPKADQFLRILGKTRDELLGKNIWEEFSPPVDSAGYRELLRALSEGVAIEFEECYAPLDTWFEVHAYPSQNGLSVYVRDISARKRAEAALREAEERYRGQFDHVPVGLFRTTPAGQILDANPALIQILGYPDREAFLAVNVTNLYTDPQDRKHLLDLLEREGVVQDSEIQVRRYNGRPIWVRVSARAIQDSEDRVVCYEGAIQDITERKQVEESLQESEAKFRQLAETVAAAIVIYRGSKLRYVNSQTESLTGYPREELLAMDFWDVVHPDFQTLVKERGLARLRGEEIPSRYEFKIVRKNGEERWVDFTAGMIEFEGDIAAIGTAYDITERKRAERALRESEESYRVMVTAAADGIITIDEDSRILFANRAAERIFGYTINEMVGQSLTMLMPERLRPVHRASLQRYTHTGKRHLDWEGVEFSGLHKSGQEILLHISFGESSRQDKHVFTGIIRDINERKRTEAALQQSEARYRNLFDTAIDTIYTLSVDGTITSLNPAFETLTGFSRAEWLGKSFVSIIHPDDLQLAMESLQIALQRKIPPPIELRILTKSGEYLVGEFKGTPQIRDGGVVGILGIACDITERKQAEQAIKQRNRALTALSQRLVAVQETERHCIARELHDQITQILTGLKFILETIVVDPLQMDRLSIEEAKSKMSEAQALVNELLTRVHGLSLNLRPAMLDDLGLLAALLWHFERFTTQTNVRVIFKHRGLQERFASEVELNAYRIIQESLTNVARHSGASEVIVWLLADRGVLHVQIEDHGKGFDLETVKATAMVSGLAGMQERAVALGGSLTVESAPGSGTRLTVELPLRKSVD